VLGGTASEARVIWSYVDAHGGSTNARERGYSLEADIRGSEARIRITGNVDLTNAAQVAEALLVVRGAIAQRAITRAVIDLRALYFLASSGLKHLAAWITAVGEGTEPRYEIAIVTDPNMHWQKRSLSALVALEPTIVRVEEET
jgi:anti-anti-sigma factor